MKLLFQSHINKRGAGVYADLGTDHINDFRLWHSWKNTPWEFQSQLTKTEEAGPAPGDKCPLCHVSQGAFTIIGVGRFKILRKESAEIFSSDFLCWSLACWHLPSPPPRLHPAHSLQDH